MLSFIKTKETFREQELLEIQNMITDMKTSIDKLENKIKELSLKAERKGKRQMENKRSKDKKNKWI